jgi:nitrogen fixation-related uncharacterized protein
VIWLILAVVCVLGAIVAWALCARAGQLDDAAGMGDDILAGCNLCPPGAPHVPDGELVDHLRLLHPDAWGDGPELWPDGEVVVADLTLEPDDFGGER